MSHQDKAHVWDIVFYLAIVLIVLCGIATITLMVYDLTKREDSPPIVNCCCPTQQEQEGLLSILPLTTSTSTPTPTSTLSATQVTVTSPTRTPGSVDPTSTARPPRPTVTPYYTRVPTHIPTWTPFVPPTQIPPALAHWHLKNDNAKLYCVYSAKGHKPNVQWYVDYDDCIAAAGG